MNKKSRNKSEAIDWIEFNSEATKFERDFQYLRPRIGLANTDKVPCVIHGVHELLCDFEDTKEPNTSEHGNSDGWNDLHLNQD